MMVRLIQLLNFPHPPIVQLLGGDRAQLRGEVPERVLAAEQPQVGRQQVLGAIRRHLRARDLAIVRRSKRNSQQSCHLLSIKSE